MEKSDPTAAHDRLTGLGNDGRDRLRIDRRCGAVHIRVARQRLRRIRHPFHCRSRAIHIRVARQCLRQIPLLLFPIKLICLLIHLLHLPSQDRERLPLPFHRMKLPCKWCFPLASKNISLYRSQPPGKSAVMLDKQHGFLQNLPPAAPTGCVKDVDIVERFIPR